MVNKKVTKEMILEAIKPNEKVRVRDIASRLYITKQKARRCLNILVCFGILQMERYHYIGNAEICVYTKM